LVLDKIRRRFPWLELIRADGGYNEWQVDAAVAKLPLLRMEIVTRSDDMKGFVVLPRRWVVERTFSWFGRNRRLAKDFENLGETLVTFVALASIQLALKETCQGVGREYDKHGFALHDDGGLQADGEETFAGTRGNDEDAPIPVIREATNGTAEVDPQWPFVRCTSKGRS
jgi:transposase